MSNIADRNWVIFFMNGKYRDCASQLQTLLNKSTIYHDASQIQTTITETKIKDVTVAEKLALRANLAVCNSMEILCSQDDKLKLNSSKLKFSHLNSEISTLSHSPIDVHLCLVYNLLWLYWRLDSCPQNYLIDFEERLNLALPCLKQVLQISDDINQLQQLQVACQMRWEGLVHLEKRQAILVTAIRVLLSLSAPDEFLSKMIREGKQNSFFSPELLRQETTKNEIKEELLLFPILDGSPSTFTSFDTDQAICCLNLTLAALLARQGKTKPALSCMVSSEAQGSLGIRALIVYFKAWLEFCGNNHQETQRLLEILIAMKISPEGQQRGVDVINCYGRLLKAKMLTKQGKPQQATHVLNHTAKQQGFPIVVMQALAQTYKLTDQVAHAKVLAMLKEKLVQIEEVVGATLPTFEEKLLSTLHPEPIPSLSSTMYEEASVLINIKNYGAAATVMVQLLAHMERNILENNLDTIPDLRALVRETALVLMKAERLSDAAVVCSRAANHPFPVHQANNGSGFLDSLHHDVCALLLLGHIYYKAQDWTKAQEAIDRCAAQLHAAKDNPEANRAALRSRLLAQCQVLSAEVYADTNDIVNATHAYTKAKQTHKNRETLLRFVKFLIEKHRMEEAHRLWANKENEGWGETSIPVNITDRVLAYLLQPRFSEKRRLELENEINKTLLDSDVEMVS